jgi:DNA invertase Pin-like site-specific DNA recombinase
MDTFVISERTSRGIQDAKVKGVIGGRPKVSDLKIEKIKYLYEKRGYTLREIADECEVSLGTAYKYIQKID